MCMLSFHKSENFLFWKGELRIRRTSIRNFLVVKLAPYPLDNWVSQFIIENYYIKNAIQYRITLNESVDAGNASCSHTEIDSCLLISF
jgi:hypothetical protein